MTNPLRLPPEIIKVFQSTFPNLKFGTASSLKFGTASSTDCVEAASEAVWPFPVQGIDQVVNPKVVDPIGIVHIYNHLEPKGGMTIAYRKSTPYKSGVMVDVAVHVCSEDDAFSKKIGNAGATEKFMNGELIQLPLLKLFGKEDISFAVKRAFTALYSAI